MNDDFDRILLKVRELYLKYGIKSITMDDVSRELAISKKTLYLYVMDKDELVGKFVDFEIQKRQEEIFRCFGAQCNAIEEIMEMSVFMTKLLRDENPVVDYDLRKYYPHHFERMRITLSKRMLDFLLDNLKKGKKEGLYREDMNEIIIAKLYLLGSENNRLHELLNSEEYSSARLFTEFITYHVRGIATGKGIAILEDKLNELKAKINK